MIKEKEKYAYVDSLRGIAILMVVSCHICVLFNDLMTYPPLGNILWMGNRGVQLFYVMSAFTIFLSFNRREKSDRHPVLFFLIRRFFRIAPLFYLAIWVYAYFSKEFISWHTILLMVTFTNSFSIEDINAIIIGSWSIAIETVFYCLVPLLYKYISNIDKALKALGLSIVFASLMSAVMVRVLNVPIDELNPYLYFYLPSQLPVFMLGLVLFFMLSNTKREDVASLQIKSGTYLMLSLLLIIHFILGGKGILSDHFQIAIGFALLAYTLSSKPYFVFVNAFTRFTGKISYSMYLAHIGVMHIVKYYLSDYVLNQNNSLVLLVVVLITLGLTYLISYITYSLVEIPFINLGQRLIAFLEGKNKRVQKIEV